jgi:TolB protein
MFPLQSWNLLGAMDETIHRRSALIRQPITRRHALIIAGTAFAAVAADSSWAAEENAARAVRIALPAFDSSSVASSETARSVRQLIGEDLRGSGHFTLADSSALIVPQVDQPPPFQAWRATGADLLVVGRIKIERDERMRSEFRLWDVAAGQQYLGHQYFTRTDRWRELSHAIASTIYERIVGEPRDFDAKP